MGGCAAFTPAERPDAPLEMPAQYTLYGQGEAMAGRWWEAFNSPELNLLVETALAGNFDIQTAQARLEQANALAHQAGAQLLPSVEAEASGALTRSQSQATSHGSRVISDEESYSAGLAAAYEVDLWGRLAADRQAELLTARAAGEDVAAATMTVVAGVVDTWVDLLATHRQIALLADQIQTNETLLNLEKLRFANGKAQALDVSQQREALAAAKAQMPLLEIEAQQLRSSLAILLGKAGTDLPMTESARLPELIALPDTGVPADLLAARPDVRAAGLRLKAADWSVAAARADRLPAITLSAAAAFSSGSLDLLFNNWLLNLAGSITGPLFDAGSRSAEVARTRAVAEEYLSAYAQTVATAVREVEDALVTEQHQATYIALLQDQLDASRTSLQDARLQYLNGQSDYLSYLTAWSSVQSLQRQLVGEQAARIKYRVTLHRALGGSWIEGLAAQRSAAKIADTPS
jgi:NodT family efflux transporter outer membrane factor (OMF) lipoprotein